MGITTPTAVMIIDQLVHRATFPSVDANFTVEWQKTLSDPVTDDISSPLPFRERITKLEGGVEGASTREIPRYIEMLKFMLDRMKWKIEEFDVYRVRVEYPLMYTKLWAKFESQPVGFDLQPHIMA